MEWFYITVLDESLSLHHFKQYMKTKSLWQVESGYIYGLINFIALLVSCFLQIIWEIGRLISALLTIFLPFGNCFIDLVGFYSKAHCSILWFNWI